MSTVFIVRLIVTVLSQPELVESVSVYTPETVYEFPAGERYVPQEVVVIADVLDWLIVRLMVTTLSQPAAFVKTEVY